MALTFFISYAHEDKSFRSDLETHLAALKRDGLLEEWHDRMISAGQDWEREIHTHLDRSHIIVLLISPDFMASSYCNEVEVKRAMQRYEMGTARVIPVLVRPTDWQSAPFSNLQALPTDALPISEWRSRDAAFADIVNNLRNVCLDVSATPGNPANPYVVAKVGDWYQAEVLIDIHPTGETNLGNMLLTLIDKNEKQATVQIEITSDDLGDDKHEIQVPLGQPLEDSMGLLVGAVSEQIPANATLESRKVGGGVEKLFIGGKTYYTTWIASEMEIRAGRDRVVSMGKRWMSSEIPLDGIVKMVMEIPNVIKQTMIVTDYGRGQGSRPKRRSPRPPRESVTLESVIVGSWNVTISQPFMLPVSASFQFDVRGSFFAQMMSPMFGMLTMEGQWQAQGSILALQGVQTSIIGATPYRVQVNFHVVSSRSLKGTSHTGENIIFTRT